MPRPPSGIAVLTLALAGAIAAGAGCAYGSDGPTLPPHLTDEEFWRLSTELSEQAGTFRHSENLVSNEALFPHAVRLLRPIGGVYIGVGPEQNFTYIAKLEPQLAFIIDIRQQNRSLHLMYKALFELSADRADFISQLFSRPRPAGLDADTSVHDLFEAFAGVSASPSLLEETARLVGERLLTSHGFPLAASDNEWIAYALRAFYTDGPEIQYARSRPEDAPEPSYRALMTAADLGGQPRSYLASAAAFAVVKELQSKNLIVPIVGDFGGSHALKHIGNYVREHGGVVSAFYGSNVEVYLSKQQAAAFCQNLADLPADSHTPFIGSKGLRTMRTKLEACAPARR